MKRLILFLCIFAYSRLAVAQTATGTPFKSGFEPSTALGSVSGNGPSGFGQTMSGTDASTGFTWPMHIWGASTFDIHLIPQSGTSDALSGHFLNSLDTLTGHTGASTKALHLLVQGYTDQSCCAQNVVEASGFSSGIKQQYFRVWYKLPSAFATQFSSFHDDFRMLWEWKTNNNYRTATIITNNGGTPEWEMQIDSGGRNCSGGSGGGYLDPNTGASFNDCSPFIYSDGFSPTVAVPINTWFLLEVFMKRSIGNDGLTQLAINGQTVLAQTGPNYGLSLEEISNLYMINEYGSRFPMEEWLDDLEIRDSLPSGCSAFPCGASETGSGTADAAPPYLTSARGAIGVVGTAFSYQTTATPSATSYGASNLPSGLSMNSSTGVISGTPSSSGRFANVNVRVTNGFGHTDHTLVFQINGSSGSVPNVSSFTASPSSISAGQWSQLQWAQSGANNLTINGVNVNGRDPYPVNPTVTTTYTLSAQNSAGSAPTRTATVTVSGTSPTPTISSFIATPSTIVPGQSSTLSWITSGATSLSIDQGVGTVTGLTSKTVTPSATTTYTLTATNTSGSVSSPPATVTVSARPTISSFTATPSTPITPGASVTLAWTSTGGTSATLNGSPVALSGTQIVSPLTTTGYTLVVSNSTGPASQTVTVNVGALPVISSFTASPSTIAIGGSSTLTLASTGGTSCSIDQGVGTVACNSSTSVSPATSKLYTVTVTNSFGSKTAQVLVGVSISALVGASVVNGQVVIH